MESGTRAIAPEHARRLPSHVRRFSDPTAFSSHWALVTETGDTPRFTASGGSVVLAPSVAHRGSAWSP